MTTLPDLDTARRWRDLLLYAADGAAVGLIEGIYVDGETGRPEWALVGLDADGVTGRTLVPLVGAAEDDGRVRVPCGREQIKGAPQLPASGTLSRRDETRLYDHYGIAYSTAASPSVLPAAETDPSDLDHPMADDQLDGVGSTLDTGAGTAGARAAVAAEPSVAPGRELVEVPPARGRGRLAGGALALAGLAGGLAAVVRRRRGSRSGAKAEVTRQVNRSKRKAARAGRRAGQAPAQLAEAGARVAKAAAKTAEAAARQATRAAERTGRQAARTAEKTGRQAARTAEQTRRKAARTAEKTGRRAARTAEDARRRAVGATADAGRAATRTAGTVAGLPAASAAAARRRLSQAAPQRKRSRKRRKGNALGRVGLALGGAVGYVLGTRAGRERYDQMVAAAKQLGERPEVKRVVEQAPGTVGQVADKAADRLGQARERIAQDRPATSPGAGSPPAPARASSSLLAEPSA
jgi:hypothetical protein